MSNTNRRYIDKNGYQFMPMNVQGGYIETRFMTTTKWITLAAILAGYVFLYFLLMDSASVLRYIIWFGLWTIFSIQLTRFIIFEEKFYYRMYLKFKESQITTPAEFWSISSIDDTPEGAILTFTDARIGVVLRLDRDTVTGKDAEFKEFHYDAISDFYKELNSLKYSFVQMNIMELAENDPRLHELSLLVNRDSNENVCRLIEEQYGYMRNITRRTLYETDYILVYTQDMSRFDAILSDVIDCAYKLLDGAYVGYGFLSQKEIVNILVKERYNVTYFDATEATMVMSKNSGYNIKAPFNISEIVFTDGKSQKIGRQELYKINKITSDILNGADEINNVSIKKAVYVEENKKEIGVDFDSISDGFGMSITNNVNNQNHNRATRQVVKNTRPSSKVRPNGNLPNRQVGNNINPNQNRPKNTTYKPNNRTRVNQSNPNLNNSNNDDYLDI